MAALFLIDVIKTDFCPFVEYPRDFIVAVNAITLRNCLTPYSTTNFSIWTVYNHHHEFLKLRKFTRYYPGSLFYSGLNHCNSHLS